MDADLKDRHAIFAFVRFSPSIEFFLSFLFFKFSKHRLQLLRLMPGLAAAIIWFSGRITEGEGEIGYLD